jgi:hypothetical protein
VTTTRSAASSGAIQAGPALSPNAAVSTATNVGAVELRMRHAAGHDTDPAQRERRAAPRLAQPRLRRPRVGVRDVRAGRQVHGR